MAVSPELRARARLALAKADSDLEAESDLSFFIASGPGGQHRNKTESGVRLAHAPSGITVTATERRSQAQNRAVALARLREKLLALTVIPKIRRPTRPSRAKKEARLDAKKRDGSKKRERRLAWD